MLTGFCGKRAFFLGPMRSFSCGNLVIQTKHSSATYDAGVAVDGAR